MTGGEWRNEAPRVIVCRTVVLLEFLVLFACLWLGNVAATVGGMVGGELGFIVGYPIGLCALPVACLAFHRVHDWYCGPWEELPCPCGEPAERLAPVEDEKHGRLRGCSCGIALDRRGVRVDAIDRAGRRRPYMRWVRGKGWIRWRRETGKPYR
jgi:hypothetical protein